MTRGLEGERIPSESFTDHQRQIAGEVQKIASQIMPGVEVEPYGRLHATEETGNAGPVDAAYFQRRGENGLAHVVAFALDADNPQKVVRHEAIHHLRRSGLLDDQEWSALDRAAKRGDWISKHDVDRLYPELDRDAHIEEAVAAEFSDWRKGALADRLPGPVQRIFQKINQFLRRLAAGARRILGRNATADDIFSKIESGEVGGRQGREPARGQDVPDFAVRRDERADKAAPPGEVRRWTDVLKNQIKGPKPPGVNDLGWLERTALHPYQIATTHREFEPVFRHGSDFFHLRSQAATELSDIAEPYFQLSAADRQKVNAALEIGRHLQLGYSEKAKKVSFTNTIGGPDKAGGLLFSKFGERIDLTEKQAEGYHAVRKMMDRSLDLFRDQFLQEHDLVGADQPKSAEELRKWIDDGRFKLRDVPRLTKAADVLEEIEGARLVGYVPFARFGDHAITVRDSFGGVAHFEMLKGGALARGRFETRRKELEQQYPLKDGYRVSPVERLTPKQRIDMAGIDLGALDELAEQGGADEPTRDAFAEAVRQGISERGFKAHFIPSKNTPGYTPDFERAIANYLVGLSSYLARRQTWRQLDESIGEIPAKKPHLQEYAKDYRSYIGTPTEEAQAWRQWMFFAHLGFNVSSAIINLSQVPLFSAPLMTTFSSPARVAAHLARAGAETLAMLRPRAKADFLDFDLNRAPADVRDALKKMDADGTLSPLVIYEQTARAQGGNPALSKVSATARGIVEASASLFSAAERLNRISTAMAVLRLARDPEAVRKADLAFAGGQDRNKGSEIYRAREIISPITPIDLARFVIDESHFVQGRQNRPTMMRGALGTTLLQFKSFMMNALEMQWRMASRYGAPGKRAFAINLALLGMSAGLLGEPFAEDAKETVEALYRFATGIGLDVETEMQKFFTELLGDKVDHNSATLIAEAARRGLFRLMGVDISQRLGMGDIIPVDPASVLTNEATSPDQARNALGVPGSVLTRAIAAMQAFKGGDWKTGATLMSPFLLSSGGGNLAKALQMKDEGVVSRKGDMLIPSKRLTASDEALRAVGVQSAPIARTFEVEQAQRQATTAAVDARERFTRQLSKAIVDKDDKAIRDVMTDVYAWNKSAPMHERISMFDDAGDPTQSLKNAVHRQREGIGGPRPNAPVRARGEQRKIGEAYPVAR